MVNVILVEKKWHLVLKLLYQKYKGFVADSSEAKPIIVLVCAAVTNILKLCHASCRINRCGEDGLEIMEEAVEN
jgi:hypothetical protein